MIYEKYIRKDGVLKAGAPKAVRVEYYKRKLIEKFGQYEYMIHPDERATQAGSKVTVTCPKHGVIKTCSLRHLMNGGVCACKLCE